MKIKGLVDYDISNYKKPSMFIIFPNCTFKCDKENNCQLCQNSSLAREPEIEISKEDIFKRYINNPLTHAFVLGGLEPFDSLFDLLPLIHCIRDKNACNDDIIIYTGYTEEELERGYRDIDSKISLDRLKEQWETLKKYPNIIVKFGRFRPNEESHYDEILGVNLASSNQYARRLKSENI